MAEVSRAALMRRLLARMREAAVEISVEASAAELDVLLDIAREIGLEVTRVSPEGESGARRYLLTFERSAGPFEVATRGEPRPDPYHPVGGRPRRHVNAWGGRAGRRDGRSHAAVA